MRSFKLNINTLYRHTGSRYAVKLLISFEECIWIIYTHSGSVGFTLYNAFYLYSIYYNTLYVAQLFLLAVFLKKHDFVDE